MQSAVKLGNNDKKSTLAFINKQSTLTVSNCIVGAQISTLKREHPEVLAEAMMMLVFNTSDALQIENKPNEMQCAEISLAIIQKYGLMLKFDEICLIFRKAKWGEFGEMYNRLDIAVVFGWIEKYLRSEERVSYIEREAMAYKKQIDNTEVSQENSAKLQEIYRDISKKKILKDGSVGLVEQKQRSKLEDYIEKLIKTIPTLKVAELEILLEDYRVQGFKQGHEMISAEIEKRKKI